MIEFAEFYEDVHKHRPFLWQEHVARRIVEHGWPENDVLDPPTAAGKTSMIDIAIFALALQCDRPALERTSPLRTFFVVDRRLVVDDVTRHALKVRSAIEESERLREIRERLCSFGGSRPLEITTLRGGMYRDDSWADMPNQPLICVSTVDQVGSRLLFRGYGVSERRRPIDAGLLGCDSLFILDEAHLSQPFLDTLGWVRKYAGWAEKAPAPAPRVVQMTATPAGESGFELPPDIYENDAALSPRLEVEKRAELKETGDIVGDATSQAREMMKRPDVRVVGVVVNRVDTARNIFERLRGGSYGAVLLTGRIRPRDRDRLINEYRDRMRAGRDREQEPMFVVATQTVEVGADLDFDALITEAAPLDALRQRFGRLNRLGEGPPGAAVILKRWRKQGDEDRIYGTAMDNAWVWLNQHAEREDKQASIDFGALRMKALYKLHGAESLNSDREEGPVMFPAHVEAWVQTYPAPEPDPDVAPFLHGPKRSAADVNIVWRADLPDNREDWREVIEAAPPISTEALPIPIWAAKQWLAGGRAGDVADVDSGEHIEEAGGQATRLYWAWRGLDDRGGRGIRPGDTIVVRSSEGGGDRFGWFPECTNNVEDIGDDCTNERARQGGGRYSVRLHPAVSRDEEEREAIKDVLAALREGDDEAQHEAIALAKKRCPDGKDWRLLPYGPEGAVRAISQWVRTKPEKEDLDKAAPAREDSNDDDTASLTVEVSLRKHIEDVLNKARVFADGCGLDAGLRAALEQAAELHDLGKWDDRFQDLLAPERNPNDEPLAKSPGRASVTERRRRAEYAQYPANARHEFWSVALVEEGGLVGGDESRDLIRHLVGTHHGFGRPIAPYWADETSVTARVGLRAITATNVTRFAALGSGWVDRFWALNWRYGYWGLAYLEAILRRADCVASREEEQNHERD